VITIVDKHSIINLKKKGHSNRKIAKMLRINRKTVAKHWYDHVKQNAELLKENIDVKLIQEEIYNEPKYTEEIDSYLGEILTNEEGKCKLLGTNK
jgi:orotate phosphoribosyltransferase-like protein